MVIFTEVWRMTSAHEMCSKKLIRLDSINTVKAFYHLLGSHVLILSLFFFCFFFEFYSCLLR